MSVYTIFPKRGIVSPADSLIALAGASGPVQDDVYLPFDCIVSESPEYTAMPTLSPVEDATTISDHVILKPLRLKVDAVISDTPLAGTPFAAAVNGGVSAFSGTSPSDKAYRYIRDLYKAQAVFDFVGGYQVYQNMIVAEFRPMRTAETGSSLTFSMVLEQVVIVNSQVLIKPSNTKAAPKQSHGGQPTQTIDLSHPDLGVVLTATPTVTSAADMAQFGPSAGDIVSILGF